MACGEEKLVLSVECLVLSCGNHLYFLNVAAPDLDFGEGAPAEWLVLDEVSYAKPIDSAGCENKLLGISGFLKRYIFPGAIGKLDCARVPVSIVGKIGPNVNDHFINIDCPAEIDFKLDIGAFIGTPGGIFGAVPPVGGVAIDDIFGGVAKLVSTFAITCGVGISDSGTTSIIGI